MCIIIWEKKIFQSVVERDFVSVWTVWAGDLVETHNNKYSYENDVEGFV